MRQHDYKVRRSVMLASMMLAFSPFALKVFFKEGPIREIVANDAEASVPPTHMLSSLKTVDDLLSSFAKPDFERRDGNMRILQYHADNCILDVYLKDDSVVHYELRQREVASFIIADKKNEKPLNEAGCVKKFSRRT